MANIITTGSFPTDLYPLAVTWFGKGYAEKPTVFDQIFKVKKAGPGKFERYAHGYGLGAPSQMGEAEDVVMDDMGELWHKNFEQTKFGTGFVVTRDHIDDSVSSQVMEMKAPELGRVMRIQKEISVANYLDDGFTDTSTGGDGKALYAADHPTVAGSFSNRSSGSVDLSEASLEQAHLDIKDMRDERGYRRHFLPRALVIPSALVHEANRILNSVGQVYTPDNTINSIKSMGLFGKVIENPYLEDDNAFHVLTDAAMDTGLLFISKREPEITSDNVFLNENVIFKSIMRYTLGHVDPRCVYGVPGSS